MTPERYALVCELFDRAEALPEEGRVPFLRAACGEDADLLAEVTRMLGAADGPSAAPPVQARALLGLPVSRPPALMGHRARVGAVAFSPDGRSLASGDDSGRITIWNVADRSEVFSLHGHTGPVTGLAFSPDGARLASAGADGSVRLWDAHRGEEWRVLRGRGAPFRAVAWSPTGAVLAGAAADGPVPVWGARSGSVLAWLPAPPGGAFALAFPGQGSWLAAALADHTVALWDHAAARQVGELPTGPVRALAALPAGDLLASGGDDGRACVWSVAPGRPLWSHAAHAGAVTGLAFLPDGALLSAGADGSLCRVEAAAVKHLRTFPGPVAALAPAPDGLSVAVACAAAPGGLVLEELTP